MHDKQKRITLQTFSSISWIDNFKMVWKNPKTFGQVYMTKLFYKHEVE